MGIVAEQGPNRNVWRTVPADRATVLVDGDAYFKAVHHALLQARHQVLIIGWDIDSRLCLRRDLDEAGRRAATLGPLLQSLVERTAGPEVYVLSWDFALIYALEREAFSQIKLGWTTHRKLHFELDNMHPVWASQHQKIVVIDDTIAFVGGLDLCFSRWDTPAHGDNPARIDPPNRRHAPFHDVQMMVTGDAATALGELGRTRWARCTGERLPPPRPSRAMAALAALRRRRPGASPPKPAWCRHWPPWVAPDFEDVRVGIARTEPPFNGRPGVREVEALHLASIAQAERHIYIENQYLTSHSIGQALAARLADVEGPEVVIVQPRECSGWLEVATMGVLRRKLISGLRGLPGVDRLRLYHPHVTLPDDARLNVHSKITIIDDRLLRIGSANLSNRSMGHDSECDLVIEAEPGDVALQRRIAAVRERLLGEHLGVEPARVAEACRVGLIAGVEALRDENPDKTLRVLDVEAASWLEPIVNANLIDPERPMPIDPLVDRVLSEEPKPHRRLRAALTLAAVVLLLGGLALMWRVTSLHEMLTAENIERVAGPIIHSPLGPVLGVLSFIVGGVLVLPLSLLTVQSGLLFGPVLGFVVAFSGALLSGALTFGIGAALGQGLVRRLIGDERLKSVRTLRTRGVLAMAALRMMPVAPYTMVNLAAGAVRIPFWTFMAGTFLGLLPGIVVLTLFASGIVAAVKQPTPGFIAALALGLIVLLFASTSLVRFVKRRQRVAPPLTGASAPVPASPSTP